MINLIETNDRVKEAAEILNLKVETYFMEHDGHLFQYLSITGKRERNTVDIHILYTQENLATLGKLLTFFNMQIISNNVN